MKKCLPCFTDFIMKYLDRIKHVICWVTYWCWIFLLKHKLGLLEVEWYSDGYIWILLLVVLLLCSALVNISQTFQYIIIFFLLTANDNLRFLINWLEEFPNYKDSDLFLTGESYAGNYDLILLSFKFHDYDYWKLLE